MPKWRIRRSMGIVLALGLLAGCSTGALPTSTPAPPPAPTTSPTVAATSAAPAPPAHFDTAVCPFTLPTFYVQGKNADCGFVTVPERHNKPDGRTIRLAVVRFRSLSATPDPVPMIYLSGGPGGTNQGLIASFDRAFTGVIGTRDVVVFDPRGVGMSQPALECPEVIAQQFQDDTQVLGASDIADHAVASAVRCRDRLVGLGIDLAAYTSVQSAADVDAIRVALGYRAGRPARHLLRDAPRAHGRARLPGHRPQHRARFGGAARPGPLSAAGGLIRPRPRHALRRVCRRQWMRNLLPHPQR